MGNKIHKKVRIGATGTRRKKEKKKNCKDEDPHTGGGLGNFF